MIATYDTLVVDNISSAVQTLIFAGIIFRAVFCAVKIMTSDEEAAQYKRRMRNAVVFGILAVLAFSLKNLMLTYFV
jgi:hypothetical protein